MLGNVFTPLVTVICNQTACKKNECEDLCEITAGIPVERYIYTGMTFI